MIVPPAHCAIVAQTMWAAKRHGIVSDELGGNKWLLGKPPALQTDRVAGDKLPPSFAPNRAYRVRLRAILPHVCTLPIRSEHPSIVLPNRICFLSSPPLQASGVGVADDVVTKYNEIKLGHKHKYIVLRISDDNTEIILEKIGDLGTTWDDFVKDLPAGTCAFKRTPI